MTKQIEQPTTTHQISVINRKYNELSDILQHGRIQTVFQPIISLKSAEVYGYEALSRITGSSVFSGPFELFQAALQYNLISELEQHCRTKALIRSHDLGIDKMLFLNICPSVLKFPDHEHGVTAALVRELFHTQVNVILEVTEYSYIEDYKLFQEAIAYYRDQGFMIAIDDLGGGDGGLKMLVQIEPDIVKIDHFLIANIHRSPKKRLLLEAIVNFCRKINAKIVAEGIETKEELDVIISMNIDFGQGYYLGKPAEDLLDCSGDACEQILKPDNTRYAMKQEVNFIGSIADTVSHVEHKETVSSIIEVFKNDQNLTFMPVVNDKGIPVGIIHKTKLFYKLGQRFGFALLNGKSVKYIMEKPLIFESDCPIEEVALKSLDRDKTDVYNAIVIVKNGIYIGIVHVYKLLARITEQKINLAIQANPLTGMCGNNIIREEIETRLEHNQLFASIYFDLDNFKPFNDTYGFEKGDYVIQFLGNLLKEKVYKWDTEGLVGHIGGDDFIAVCRPKDIEILCKEIIQSFNEGIRSFFNEEAIKKGYYTAMDRKGKNKRYPLLSLSFGVVSTGVRSISSYGELASIVTEVKRKAKSISGNSYYIDHRENDPLFSNLCKMWL